MWRRRREGTTGEILAELTAKVAGLREEVRGLREQADRLLVWMRTCYRCGAVLRKEDPAPPWRCGGCGWPDE